MRFDLETLAAPLEALRPELETAYDALDAEWQEVHDKLRSLPIPCPIVMPIKNWTNESTTTLEWRKQPSGWRFCIVNKKPAKAGRGGGKNKPSGPGDATAKGKGGPKGNRGKRKNGCGEHVVVKPFEQWTAQQRLNQLRHVPEFFEHAAEQTQRFIDRAKNAKACRTKQETVTV